jgi:hypothetical protein
MGSLDLKVSNDGTNWYSDNRVSGDIGVALLESGLHWPCQWEWMEFYLHSVSEPDGKMANAYICLKNFGFEEYLSVKHPDGRPEPEVVAEMGGWLANQSTCACNPQGIDPGAMAKIIEVVIYMDWNDNGSGDANELILGDPDGDFPVYLSELWDGVTDNCCWISLGQLEACEQVRGWVGMHITNISEEEVYDLFGFVCPDTFDDSLPFNDWPTNAFQLDKATFEATWGLAQDPITGDYLYPACASCRGTYNPQ